MANVYVEARPKGRPEERTLTIMWSKTTRTMSSAVSQLRKQESIGRRQTVTIPLSLASGTSITRGFLTIGGRLKVYRRVPHPFAFFAKGWD
jgi:hypothetical protein